VCRFPLHDTEPEGEAAFPTPPWTDLNICF